MTTIDLGSPEVGGSGVGNLTVTNVGSGGSGVLNVVPSAGVTATGCSGRLGAGASCTLTISAIPTLPGSFTGTVAISADPGAVTPLIVYVTAFIYVGEFSVAPAGFDLGKVLVGEIVPDLKVAVQTNGDLSDLMFAASGPDIAVDKLATTCTAVLARGSSCVVIVKFLATSAGAKQDAVVITAGGAAGKTATVPIIGVAQSPPRLMISPSSAQSFATDGTAPSPAVTFQVANGGDVPTGSLAVGFAGAESADFRIASTNCSVLYPLASCTVSVVFDPGVSDVGAVRSTTLVVGDTGTGASTVVVPLIGTLQAPVEGRPVEPRSVDAGRG